MTTEPQVAAVRAVVLPTDRFKLDWAGSVTAQWVAAPPQGHTLQEILRPGYWAHHAATLQKKPDAIIRILPEGGGWSAILGVLGAGHQAAQVFVMHHWEHGDQTGAADDSFSVEWSGPFTLWRIRRKSDNEIVDKGITTKEAAYARLPELMRRAA